MRGVLITEGRCSNPYGDHLAVPPVVRRDGAGAGGPQEDRFAGVFRRRAGATVPAPPAARVPREVRVPGDRTTPLFRRKRTDPQEDNR